jgi:hypothetical protein
LKKEQVDLANKVVFIAESKTPTGVAEVPLTDIAVAAFRSQIDLAGPGPWLFPSAKKPTDLNRKASESSPAASSDTVLIRFGVLTVNDTKLGRGALEVVEKWWARQDSNL